MKRNEENWFEKLEPPPNGLALLRKRLAEDASRRVRSWWGVPSVAAAAGLLLITTWLGGVRPIVRAKEAREVLSTFGYAHPALIVLGLREKPSEPVSIPPPERHLMAVERIPVERADVIFYLIGSRSTDEGDKT